MNNKKKKKKMHYNNNKKSQSGLTEFKNSQNTSLLPVKWKLILYMVVKDKKVYPAIPKAAAFVYIIISLSLSLYIYIHTHIRVFISSADSRE
jgi:hypothetical protein